MRSGSATERGDDPGRGSPSSGRGRMALISALGAELRGLRRSLGAGRSLDPHVPGGRLAHYEGREIAVLNTGPGPDRAELSVRRLLEQIPVDRAIAVGFGGGLAPSLRSGDILLADEVMCPESPGEVRRPDPGLLKRARSLQPAAFRIETGRLASVSRPLSRAEEKSRLGTSSGSLLVDMETIGVARALDAAGVPSLYARCVVDESALDMEPRLVALLDSRGRVRPLHVLRFVALHPAAIPLLYRLGARSRRAAVHLAWLVRHMM